MEVAFKMAGLQLGDDDIFTHSSSAERVTPLTDDLACKLLSDRAAEHGRLQQWRSSLDDAIASLVFKCDKPDSWVLAITALTHLNHHAIAQNVLLPEASTMLTAEQLSEIKARTQAMLCHPLQDSDKLQDAYLASLHAEGAPWLALLVGDLNLVTLKKNRAVSGLKDLDVTVGPTMQRLAEVESGDILSVCFLTRRVVSRLYKRMRDLVAEMGAPVADVLFGDPLLLEALKMSFGKASFPGGEEELSLRIMQMRFVEEVARVWSLARVRMLFGVTPSMARPWVTWAGGVRGQMVRGKRVSESGFLGLARLSLLLRSGEEVDKAGAVRLVVGILEASAVLVRIYNTDHLMEEAIAHTFNLVELIGRAPGGLLDAALGEGAVGKAKPMWLLTAWSNHWNGMVRRRGTVLMKKLYPKMFKGESEETIGHLDLEFCSGSCEPQRQEKEPEEYALYHSRPSGLHKRTYFCSHACFRERMDIVLSARMRLALASVNWKNGIQRFRQLGGHLAESENVVSKMQKLAEEGFVFCTAALFVDERIHGLSLKAHRAKQAFADAFDIVCLPLKSKSYRTSALSEFAICCMDLVCLQDEVEKSLHEGTEWHQRPRNMERARTLKQSFGNLRPKLTESAMRPMMSLLSRPQQDFKFDGSYIPMSTLDWQKAAAMRLLELQAVVVLHLLWEDPDLHLHVISLLNEWLQTSVFWDQPRAWLLRGHLYSLLYLHGEKEKCKRCMEAGVFGWAKSWTRFEELADPEELGAPDVFRCLLQMPSTPSSRAHLMKLSAESAERASNDLWKTELNRQRSLLSPTMRDLNRRFPRIVHSTVPHGLLLTGDLPDHDKCAACGEREQLGNKSGQGIPLQLCSSCKLVAYCSQECQKSSWKLHKPLCQKEKALRYSNTMEASSGHYHHILAK